MDHHGQVIWSRIGPAIRARRRLLRISVDKLADQVGVVRQQIVRLEAGLGGTTLPRLVLIAEALDMPLGDLLSVIFGTDTLNKPSDKAEIIEFRGHALTPEEADQVLDYIAFLEYQREKH